MKGKSRLRVLMVNTFEASGGAAIACNRLISAINRHHDDVEITLLVLKKESSNENVVKAGSAINFYLEKMMFFFKEKTKSIRFAFSSADFGNDITNLDVVKNADIIHLHWVNQGFLSLKNLETLLRLDKAVFWTFHDMWPMTGGCHHSYDCINYQTHCGNCDSYLKQSGPNDLSASILKSKKTWLGRKTIRVISPSLWMNRRIEKSVLFKKNTIFSIPNPVDSKVFKPLNIKKQKGKGVKILFVAASVENHFKGFGLFLEILNKLSKKGVDISVIIVGKVSSKVLTRIPFNCELKGHVGSEKKMAQIYNEADLFVSTSRDESFSYTCLEAIFCQIPVIAYSTGEIPQFIESKKNGYLVEDYTCESFEEGFDWFFKNQKNISFDEKALGKYNYLNVSNKVMKAYECF